LADAAGVPAAHAYGSLIDIKKPPRSRSEQLTIDLMLSPLLITTCRIGLDYAE